MRPPVYRRGDVWWCRVRAPSGRAQRVSTRCRDYAAAVEVWRQLERRAVADPDRPTHSPALADALDAHLEERRAAGRAAGTLSMLAQKARHLVRVLGEDTPLVHVDARAVDRYVETRLAEGAARATVAKELSTLRGALRLAARRGEWRGDVGAVMPLGFGSGYTPRTTRLTAAQVDRLLAAGSGWPWTARRGRGGCSGRGRTCDATSRQPAPARGSPA